MTDRSHAQLMLDHALALVSWETERPVDVLREELRAGDKAVHSSLRYALARLVARDIGTLVRTVYVYGSPMENRAGMNSDIDLLVVPARNVRFARRRLRELDDTLTGAYQTLLGPAAGNLSYLLDYHLITNSDIRKRKGYAAILSDPHALPPEKIFDRTHAA